MDAVNNQRQNMKICLFTSVFFNNIGNGFIDLGAEEQLKASMPKDAQIVKLSQCANFAASLGTFFAIKELPVVEWLWTRTMQRFVNKLHDKSYKAVSTLDVFSPALIAEIDYLVIPGCVLTVPFFVIFGEFLKRKVAQGCNLVFLGVSGNYYTVEELTCVREWLGILKPKAIIFRDSVAYNNYASLCDNSYNGIDCVWFVNRLNIPEIKTNLDPYIVLNFDLPKNSRIKNSLKEKYASRNIVYTDHKPYPYTKVSKLAKKDVLCSDYPLDYLFIYKHVFETYTDRVHACIPTLSFGNKAQLFSDSPRVALFENVGIDLNELKQTPLKIDQEQLRVLQDAQIRILCEVLSR